MISTVTTATVSTVTTATATVGVLGVSFGFIAVMALCVLLVQKEIIASNQQDWAKLTSRALNVAIVPLLIAFVMIALAKLQAIFG
jgi:hypothetical protein